MTTTALFDPPTTGGYRVRGALTSPSSCTFDGCDGPHRARGFCAKHYGRWAKYGDPAITASVTTVCTLPDCDRPHSARGYCSGHYHRYKRHGDPYAGGPVQERGPHRGALPAGPLLAYVAAQGGAWAVLRAAGLATKKSAEARALDRAVSTGHLSVTSADRLCVSLLGVHPWVIYGDTWWIPVDQCDDDAEVA